MFYIAQNSIVCINKEELSYYNYIIDSDELYYKIANVIELNYPNNDIVIESIKYVEEYNLLKIKAIIKLKPVVLNKFLGNLNIMINEDVKIKDMVAK
ncbi:hypothetical protein D3C73_1440970 [compost metagenome]